PAPAAPLRLVHVDRLGLRVARAGQRDDERRLGNEVLDRQIVVVLDDLGAARVGVALAYLPKLVANHGLQLVGVREDQQVFVNIVDYLAEIFGDLLLLEARQAVQAQFEDRLRLARREAVALVRQAAVLGQVFRARVLRARPLEHADDRAGPPHA